MIECLKIKNSLKIIFVFPLFFVLCSMFLSEANAQSLSLSIWPPLLEVMIQPGKSITQVYKLTNGGETDLVVNSQIVSFEPADELGNIVIRDTQNVIRKNQDENTSLVSPITSYVLDWFSFQNADLNLGQNFLLKQGQAQQIVLAVKTPTNAKEDDYYLTLLFETQPSDLNEGLSEARAQAKIGANILLTVSETGEPPRKAEIEEFRLSNFQFRISNFQLIDSFTNPRFLLRVKNTGRSFFKPMGTITTTGWLGQKFISDLLPENVLVDSMRAINCAIPDSPEEGSPCQLKSKFLFGPYQARVEFGLDKISSDYTAKINFIALPIKLILGILILVILFIIIKKFRQNRLKISLDK